MLLTPDKPYALLCADIRDIVDDAELIPDGSVDAVICDPPYAKEYLYLYEPLGKLAARVLKPIGPLLAMVGHLTLPEVCSVVGKWIAYRWILAYSMEGAHAALPGYNLLVGWKPIVWWAQVLTAGRWRPDMLPGGGRTKTHHPWEQSARGFMLLVHYWTSPGDIILDPFMGGGTTGVAALSRGRRFIGLDIDPACIDITRKRLDEVLAQPPLFDLARWEQGVLPATGDTAI